jgi:hypothetical protein
MSDNLAKLAPPAEPSETLDTLDTIEGVVIATIVGFDRDRVLVQVPGQPIAMLVSQSCGRRLDNEDLGAEVALSFVDGDPMQPLIIDKITRPAQFSPSTIHSRELVFEADRQITLRCGKSSITLTRDGQIVIRGKDLLSRASSVNRVRGGVIQLN